MTRAPASRTSAGRRSTSTGAGSSPARPRPRAPGIQADLGTHGGRRTVVTTLFVDGDEALEDIARFVGHARPSTTAGYVKRLGHRPQSVAKRAAGILDAQALDLDASDDDEGSESPADFGSNRGSYGPESSDPAANGDEP